MELAKSFDPRSIEGRWYAEWERSGLFEPTSERNHPAYCIQLPPPNVTGTLHMGHAFQQTLMDALIRYHRMRGHDTNWIVGTDHAGIATQIVVERQLEQEGKTRHDLGRKGFIERVWEWKGQSGSTITRQMRRLGASANWRYADTEGTASGYFTMDERMSKAVTEVFVRLHEQGLIYRGKRLVNWDPMLATAVSDLEVDTEEEDGRIWEIRYPLENGEGHLVVATTRPETLFGDMAVAVHPADDRYRQWHGRQVVLPLVGKTIPIITDEYVDPAFGTGCVKITPAHDFNDYAVAQRHGLPLLQIMTLEGKISENAPAEYRGLDRFVARKRALADLKEAGLLVSEKPYRLRVPRSGRTGVIVEPMLTDQWFVRMTPLAKPALDAVAQQKIRFYPDHWATTYNHWLENIQDWCISRQLWWGHRIPAWYDAQGRAFVARTEEAAYELAREAGSIGPLTRDEDVLDTWFSSALVPFTSLGWPEDSPDLKRYLPSSVLVTGFDIIFFWVARMVMMSLHFTGEVPFRHVYINALVRDAEGQKMSKSKGNTLDPLDLIDGIGLEQLVEKSTTGLLRADHRGKIENYVRRHFPEGIPPFGADALRFTFASLATFARTLNFDMSRCEGYRNFCNKLWNASRFVLMNVEGEDLGDSVLAQAHLSIADRWITSLLQRAIAEVHQGFADYRFDNAANAIYKFVWDEYCDWYLEIAKTQLSIGSLEQKIATRRVLVDTLAAILRLAHPVIPFITEELWQTIGPLAGVSSGTIMRSPFPEPVLSKIDKDCEDRLASWKALISACRNLRDTAKVPPSRKVPLHLEGGEIDEIRLMEPYLQALGKVSALSVDDRPAEENLPTALVGNCRLTLMIEVDPVQESQRLGREISRLEKEVARIEAKLGNAAFAERAPAEVVQLERQRLAEFASNLSTLRPQLERITARMDAKT